MINNNIKGTSEIYGVIGNPIHHTFSPAIHNTMAQFLNKDIAYIPLKVEQEDLSDAIKGAYALNIKGLNITVPHKVSVMQSLCKIDKAAEVIGAVNTLKYTPNGYEGYNTDVIGAYYAIKNDGYEIKDKTILLLGAGGAANACAVMSAQHNCKKLYIANRTLEKAQLLAKRVMDNYDCDVDAISINDIDIIPQCDIIINTTTMGFGDNIGISPVKDINFYKNKNVKLVFDAIYAPWQTQLLADAKDNGCHTINGFTMLVYQAVAAEEIWFDEQYDNDFKEKLCVTLSKFYKEQN